MRLSWVRKFGEWVLIIFLLCKIEAYHTLWRKLSTRELMLLNCVVGEDSWESLWLQGDPTSLGSWVFIRRTDANAEIPILWPPHAKSWLIGKDLDAGGGWGLGAGGKGDDRGWDGWMASLTLWTWVWVNSGSWWWTGRPGVLWFMGSQRVGHDWVTELNWICILMSRTCTYPKYTVQWSFAYVYTHHHHPDEGREHLLHPTRFPCSYRFPYSYF